MGSKASIARAPRENVESNYSGARLQLNDLSNIIDRLPVQQWQAAAEKHRRSVERWSVPFRERRKIGKVHPVDDFLFQYYQYSSAKLEQWHPPGNVLLVDATVMFDEHGRSVRKDRRASRKVHGPVFHADYYTQTGRDCFCDPSKMKDAQRRRCRWIIDMLTQTQNRKPNFACFGMHEWAMVYGGDQVRHGETTPLRLSQQEINQVVESRPIHCSHFDAFRFFAIDARPFNRLTPTQDNRPSMEQPGCIHANMDLYKWAFKCMPWIGSALLMECFELALAARVVDMRASPYDLSIYGDYRPLKVETAEGRLEYEKKQRAIADAAQPLRKRLIAAIEQVSASC